MTLSQNKSLARKVKDFVTERKNSGVGIGVSLGITHSESHHDLEMVKNQEAIDSTLDKIRALIIDKTMESDQLIDQCAQMLK